MVTERLGPYLLGPNDTPENGIYTGDARELAEAIPDESVDLVVTDPPYFLPSRTYVGTRENGYTRTLADASILEAYFGDVFREMNRWLKTNGTCYVFCDAKSYPHFYRVMFPYFKHIRLLIWDKLVSFQGFTWRHQHELIAWGERDKAARIPTGDGDVLKCRGVLQADRLHPAEKPLSLVKQLIEKHEEARIVADLFVGSGTVALGATELSRGYLAFEIDPQVAEMARQRVRETQPPLFVPEVEQLAIGI